MNKIEKEKVKRAIKVLKESLVDKDCIFWLGTNNIFAYDVAIQALEQMQEREENSPLTLTELEQMEGDKIYIEYMSNCTIFNNTYAPYYGKYQQYIMEHNGMLRGTDLLLQYYGKMWIAYRYKSKGVN